MPERKSMTEFVEDGAHLPRPLRDFHDAKDLFKSLHDWIGKPVVYGYPDVLLRQLEAEGCSEKTIADVRSDLAISWVDGQCYVVDYFLRFMAAHGWTLQRSRAHVEFASLDQTIAERRQRDVALTRAMFDRAAQNSVGPRAPRSEGGAP